MHNRYINNTNRAFTLVEMAVVLVLISLILAILFGGKSIVNAMRVQTVITDVAKYKASIQGFELKHHALPGEFRSAYELWGSNCHSLQIKCDGNGNGIINEEYNEEPAMFWKHLYLSGEHDININPGWTSGAAERDVTIPGSSISDSAVFGVEYRGWVGTSLLHGRTGHNLKLATIYKDWWWGPATSTRDALNIDTKMDDGSSDTGDVMVARTHEDFNHICTDGDDPLGTSTSYYLLDKGISCAMAFFFDEE